MRVNAAVVLLLNIVINILVNYYSSLSDNRDFLFKPELPVSYNLRYTSGVFAYIVNTNLTLI